METPYPPSIRDYRSEAEYQREMALWCAEFEPEDTTPYLASKRIKLYAPPTICKDKVQPLNQ